MCVYNIYMYIYNYIYMVISVLKLLQTCVYYMLESVSEWFNTYY